MLKAKFAPAQILALGERRTNQPLINRVVNATALSLMLVVVWTLTHHDLGLTRDAHLYAFQALAKLHPALHSDVYLKYASQDRFTVFSPLYAAFISAFGLNLAGALLLGLCAASFLVAAWFFARSLTSGDLSWLSVALLIVTVGSYGSYDVFHFSEDYLTARSLAEALVMIALACHFNGHRVLGLVIAAGAMAVHPLMAFPGLLLLLCSWTSIRWNFIVAVGGVFAALALSVVALTRPLPVQALAIMDPAWLEVVRERSQFLFLQFWKVHDWDLNARSFLCLAVTAWAIDEPRIRRLCIAAALVGAAGLAVTLISSFIGPVALLLQGQAWRWVWITSMVCVVLLPATAVRLWRDELCGPLCAVLLISAWTFSPISGTGAAGLTLLLWSLRTRITGPIAILLRWAAVALVVIVAGWVLANTKVYAGPTFDFRDAPLWLQRARNIFGLKLPALFIAGIFWIGIRRCRTLWVSALWCAALAALAVYMLPLAFTQAISFAASKSPEFADWRQRIPLTANVYVDDGGDSPVFVWFNLGRPNYLSVDQSAGVVFSRATALEIKRRAENLRPLMAADWRLLARNRRHVATKPGKKPESVKPLTREILIAICKDPELGFVIARQNVGFEPARHTQAGKYLNWNLYDCAQVRSAGPPA